MIVMDGAGRTKQKREPEHAEARKMGLESRELGLHFPTRLPGSVVGEVSMRRARGFEKITKVQGSASRLIICFTPPPGRGRAQPGPITHPGKKHPRPSRAWTGLSPVQNPTTSTTRGRRSPEPWAGPSCSRRRFGIPACCAPPRSPSTPASSADWSAPASAPPPACSWRTRFVRKR